MQAEFYWNMRFLLLDNYIQHFQVRGGIVLETLLGEAE